MASYVVSMFLMLTFFIFSLLMCMPIQSKVYTSPSKGNFINTETPLFYPNATTHSTDFIFCRFEENRKNQFSMWNFCTDFRLNAFQFYSISSTQFLQLTSIKLSSNFVIPKKETNWDFKNDSHRMISNIIFGDVVDGVGAS